MNFFSLLVALGGLAMFLFGMEVMGKALAQTSGGELEKSLETLTSSKFKAVLLGAGVTAVIQSSSATTVMVVGLVNSGVMKLGQAINVIMGANIGTTVTSWILSLTGIESDNFFIMMLKPSSFSPVIAIIGVFILLLSRKERRKEKATIAVGFAVLMFGMQTMSDALKPLADEPEFIDILTMFSNPLLGVVAGAIFTAVIQSSSASVGVLQALSLTGAVTYATTIPIIMGQNIGTCITAILSSIGTKKNAKRAALVHLSFNLLGTIIFIVLFYTLNYALKFTFVDGTASVLGIAIIHTIFNLVTTVLLLPFSKQIEKLTYLLIPRDADDTLELLAEGDFRLLDEIFLETPPYAMQQCKVVTGKMAEMSRKTLHKALSLLDGYDEKTAEDVMRMEDKVDRYEDKLGSYLVNLSSRDLSEKDSMTMSELLRCIGDFERIADYSVNIMEGAKELHEKKLYFSESAQQELRVFAQVIADIVDLAIEVFKKGDIKLARTVEPLEEVADYLKIELKQRHVNRLTRGACTIELGFVYSDIITSFERIADHCSNIGICIIQTNRNLFETHKYLDKLNKGPGSEFDVKYNEFRAKYSLPEARYKDFLD